MGSTDSGCAVCVRTCGRVLPQLLWGNPGGDQAFITEGWDRSMIDEVTTDSRNTRNPFESIVTVPVMY